MAGIICIESELQITKRGNRLTLNSEPLIKFIGEMYSVPVLYRRVATQAELEYYLGQFKKAEYKKYDVLYFSSHGNTHSIHLEGDNKNLTLTELKDLGKNVFSDRFVHFSSCRTLLGSNAVAQEFKDETGALIVSGYTKSVDEGLSAVHDVAMFGSYFTHKQVSTSFRALKKNFGVLEDTLGFKVFM